MSPFHNLSIRAKVSLMGTILIVAFLVLGASFAFSLNTLLTSNLMLTRTQIALRESSEFLNSVLEMRTLLRDYLESGQASHLEPYEVAQEEVLKHLENLRLSVADPNHQQPIDQKITEQITRIDGSFRNWKSEVADPYLKLPKPTDERTLFRFLDASEDQLKEVRREVKSFQSEQQQLNRERLARADRAASIASQVAFLGSGLALLLALLGFSILSRSIMDPLFRLIDMGQSIASGDYSQRIPYPGHSELGRLSESFNVMAENLETARGEQTAIRSRLEALNRLAAYVSRSLMTRDRAEAVAMTLRRDFGANIVQVWLPESERGWVCIEIQDSGPLEYHLYTHLPEKYQSVAASRHVEQKTNPDTGEVEWISPLLRADRISGILRLRFPVDQWNVTEPLLSSINRFCTHAFELSRVYEEVSAERQRLDAILNSTGEGVLVRDRQGHIALANPAALRVLGLENRPVLGLPLNEVLNEERYIPLRHFIVSPSHDGDGPESSGALPLDDRFLTATRAPILDTEMSGTVVVIRDITQQVEVDRMKNEFISIVSHELRTPLTSIKGSLGLLIGGAGGALPDKVQQLLLIAQSNTDRLIRLINDILDISKIEAGGVKMEKEPLEIGKIIQSAVENLEGMAKQERVSLRVHVPPEESLVVVGDRDRLCQVITNLVSNAIKFSPPDTEVKIQAQQLDSIVEVDIIDQGPGIPMEHQEKLFQKFYQVDSSSSRAKSGTGLGLAISNAIVKEHSGLMGVESQDGQGSRFWFTLPVHRQGLASLEIDSEIPRVLIYEPDLELGKRIAGLLEENGYLCETSQTGNHVLDLVKVMPYDLITLNLTHPGLDGWKLVRCLEEDPRTRSIAVAFLSSAPENGEGSQLRLDGWVSRPAEAKQLQDILRRSLKFGRRKEDLETPEAAPLVLTLGENSSTTQIIGEAIVGTGMRVVMEEGTNALPLIRKEPPDALILDLQMRNVPPSILLEALHESQEDREAPLIALPAEPLMKSRQRYRDPEGYRRRTLEFEAQQSVIDELSQIIRPHTPSENRELAGAASGEITAQPVEVQT